MSSFEEKMLGGMDKNRQSKEFLHPNIEKAHRRTEHIFQKEAVDMNLFVRDEKTRKGAYKAEEIKEDIEKARALKKKFREGETEVQKNLRKQAEVAEGLVYRGIGKYGWFGEEAEAIKTTEFDDYIYGVDEIVVFGKDSQILQNAVGLMIDVTFSSDRNTGGMDKKFARAQQEIEEGHLSSIKYFYSKNNPRFMGSFSDMPRVIIGMERPRVRELATLWINEDREHELADHPVQRMILEQILAQLKAQGNYAESLGKNDLADIIRKDARIIKEILDSKTMPLGDLQFDEVHRQIMEAAKNFGAGGGVANVSSPRRSVENNDGTAPEEGEVVRDEEKYPRRPKLSLKK